MSLSTAETYVLNTCATWLEGNKNGGWVGFAAPNRNDNSMSDYTNRSRYDAACRLASCHLLEMKLEVHSRLATFRLRPTELARIVADDPSIFPQGHPVMTKTCRAVLLEYDKTVDYAVFLAQPDGERQPHAYSLGELSEIDNDNDPALPMFALNKES